MLRCALLGVLLGVASAARQQAVIDCTSSDAALSKRLQRGSLSADAAMRLQSERNSLSGSYDRTASVEECNPDIPPQGPPVDVPDIQPAPFHNISHPPNAICAVSLFLGTLAAPEAHTCLYRTAHVVRRMTTLIT